MVAVTKLLWVLGLVVGGLASRTSVNVNFNKIMETRSILTQGTSQATVFRSRFSAHTSKNENDYPLFVEALDKLNANFKAIDDKLSSCGNDEDSIKGVRDVFFVASTTLSNMYLGRYPFTGPDRDIQEISEKLDSLRFEADNINKTVSKKTTDWDENTTENLHVFFHGLVDLFKKAVRWQFKLDVEFRDELLTKWKGTLGLLEDAETALKKYDPLATVTQSRLSAHANKNFGDPPFLEGLDTLASNFKAIDSKIDSYDQDIGSVNEAVPAVADTTDTLEKIKYLNYIFDGTAEEGKEAVEKLDIIRSYAESTITTISRKTKSWDGSTRAILLEYLTTLVDKIEEADIWTLYLPGQYRYEAKNKWKGILDAIEPALTALIDAENQETAHMSPRVVSKVTGFWNALGGHVPKAKHVNKQESSFLGDLEKLHTQLQIIVEQFKKRHPVTHIVSIAFVRANAVLESIANAKPQINSQDDSNLVQEALSALNINVRQMDREIQRRGKTWNSRHVIFCVSRLEALQEKFRLAEKWIDAVKDEAFAIDFRTGWEDIEESIKVAKERLDYNKQSLVLSAIHQSKHEQEQQLLDVLDALNEQFQNLTDETNSASGDKQSSKSVSSSFWHIFATLKSLSNAGFYVITDVQYYSIVQKLDSINDSVKDLRDILADKSNDWDKALRKEMEFQLRFLLKQMHEAEKWYGSLEERFVGELKAKWVAIEKDIDEAEKTLGHVDSPGMQALADLAPSSQIVRLHGKGDKAVVITDFLGEVQEGIQSLTSALKDYERNDNKKEDAINNDMKRILKALAGTIKISKDQLSPEDERKASGLLHDLSFSVDNMFDALLDIKPEDLKPAYRRQLSEDFRNLGMFAGFLTEWVHSLLAFDNFAQDGGFWKHMIGVFDEAASTLEDPKAGVFTGEILSGNSPQKQMMFTKLTSQRKDDDKRVNIIDFVIDTRGAVIDVMKALKDYKPNNKKEEAIDKAMDKLDEIFDLSHNFGKHELSNDSQKQVSHLLHDLAFTADDLLDAVFEKRKEFEHVYSAGLGKRFHALQESGEKLTAWVGRALSRVWREKKLDYWRHTADVFGAVGDALGDFETGETAAAIRSRRKMRLQIQTGYQLQENEQVTIPEFFNGVHDATEGLLASFQNYEPIKSKEQEIKTAFDKVKEVFTISNHRTLSEDTLSLGTRKNVEKSLHETSDFMDKLLSYVNMLRGDLSEDFNKRLALYFKELQNPVAYMSAWVERVLSSSVGYEQSRSLWKHMVGSLGAVIKVMNRPLPKTGREKVDRGSLKIVVKKIGSKGFTNPVVRLELV